MVDVAYHMVARQNVPVAVYQTFLWTCTVASLIPKLWRLHNSLKGQVNNIGCISHSWFKPHSEVVVNWVHAIHKNWLFSKLQKVLLQKKAMQYQYHHEIVLLDICTHACRPTFWTTIFIFSLLPLIPSPR